MSDEVKPALTPDEWGVGLAWKRGEEPEDRSAVRGIINQYLAARDFNRDGMGHALAALCLHGQPFGFTHEDVEDERHELRILEGAYDSISDGVTEVAGLRKLIGRKKNRIARIAALLPPKSTEAD